MFGGTTTGEQIGAGTRTRIALCLLSCNPVSALNYRNKITKETTFQALCKSQSVNTTPRLKGPTPIQPKKSCTELTSDLH